MSTAISTRSHHAAFDENTPHALCTNAYSAISPLTLVPSSSSSSRSDLVPLAPTKLVASTSSSSRRGVNWSLKNDLKLFDSSDSIISSSPAPPPSIRSYIDSDSAYDTPSSSRITSVPSSDPPSNVRSILKQKSHQIRIAKTVEEGTLNNKEAARQIVTSKRPKLLPRDSFQLAVMKGAAPGVVDKGKGKMVDDQPASDESSSSSGSDDRNGPDDTKQDEAADEIEEGPDGGDDSADVSGLVEIILDGAEDLLTLEEAYIALTTRLRRTFGNQSQTEGQESKIRSCTQPIRDESPAMVRAMQRDLHRLMGKVPNTEIGISERDSSPFRGLMPLQDGTPITKQRLTPSPTPTHFINGIKVSPDNKPSRKGYTEAEVRYRREASGVGAGVLRLIAFMFHTPQLYSCFSDADLQALLEQVLVIPRTPKLPTPNQKRSYFVSILVLAQMKIPVNCISPVEEKIVRALESAINDTLGNGGSPLAGKEGPSQAKKEGFHAVGNILSTYPSIFFPFYSDLLPGCLRCLTSPINVLRNKAAAGAAAFASAKIRLTRETQSRALQQSDPTAREEWIKTKSIIQKSEAFVVSHLSSVKSNIRSSPVYTGGDRRTEWSFLEQMLKDKVSDNACVLWACATWSVIVTLMGTAYVSSSLTTGLDHIMERSMSPTTNTVRPPLAGAAWNHALHSYLAPTATSISNDGTFIQTFRPLLPSPTPTSERLKSILLPVTLALQSARDPLSCKLVITAYKNSQRKLWLRSEKIKKIQWMITCGLNAATIVCAFTGTALLHQDQPAKVMMAITGIPSSDGPNIPETALQESRIPHLDNTWDKVVFPMLKQFIGICGIDELKLHGWEMLEAITSTTTSTPDLDKLLCSKYINGEAFNADKDSIPNEFIEFLQQESIKPSEIPSWGHLWVVRRLGRLLDLFEENVQGIRGISDLDKVEWVQHAGETILFPKVLSKIWTNLLQALASAHTPDTPPTPLFMTGLQAITRVLVHAFERNPSTYVPTCMTDSDGEYVGNADLLRIQVFTHMFDSARTVLGDNVLGGIRVRTTMIVKNPLDEAIFETALGKDANDSTTVVGSLLGQILRTKHLDFPTSRTGFKELIDSLLDVGSVPGFSAKLLGDLTNHLPWIFEDHEEAQLAVWSSLASKWAHIIDLQPSSTTSPTNHTGALLVNLLSGPFRGRQLTSFWHQSASRDDLSVWQSLLEAAVLRSRAKRVGSNLGVLESLAGHLSDFLDQGEKTRSSTITLSCLASAAAWISFVPSELHHGTHYSINENFVPVDFLSLICNALLEAYPSQESLMAIEGTYSISPAVDDLLESIRIVFEDLPGEFVIPVLEPLKTGLGVWLADETRLAKGDLGERLDNLYITLLEVLSKSIQENHLPATPETLNTLIEIYAPRLSRALSPAVPAAFQSFWSAHFEGLHISEMSEDVLEFVEGIKAAVPFLIRLNGLEDLGDRSSQSEELFPHSQSLCQANAEQDRVASTHVVNELNVAMSDNTILVEQEALPAELQTHSGPVIAESPAVHPETFAIPDGQDLSEVEDQSISELDDEEIDAVCETLAPGSPDPDLMINGYEADISQNDDIRPDVRSSNDIEPTKPVQAEVLVELVPESSSPTIHAEEEAIFDSVRSSESRSTRSTTHASGTSDSGDVFGPAGMPNARKRRGKRSRSTNFEVQSLPQQKRSKATVLTNTQSLPVIKADVAVDYDSDCIVVDMSPPPSSRSINTQQTSIKAQSSSKQIKLGKEGTSLVSSASQWFTTKIPSSLSGLFSPSRTNFEAWINPPVTEDRSVAGSSVGGSERSARKARRNKQARNAISSTEGSTTESSLTGSASKVLNTVPIVEIPRSRPQKRQKKAASRSRSNSRAPSASGARWEDVDGEDDELLLSPESARAQQREEEAEIHRASLTAGVQMVAESIGRFDDAPNDPSPLANRISNVPMVLPRPPTAGPNISQSPIASPTKRTDDQIRLLSIIEEAKKMTTAIEGMDLTGLEAMLSNLDELRNLATRNVVDRAREGNKLKRKGRK